MIPMMRRLRRSERGAAMIEFAIVLPLLLLFICGIVDFGRALWAVNLLTSAARQGGRWAAAQDQPSTAEIDSVVLAAIPSTVPISSSLSASNVTVSPGTITNGVTTSITVTITGVNFQAITPLPGLIGLGSITFPDISATFRYERAP